MARRREVIETLSPTSAATSDAGLPPMSPKDNVPINLLRAGAALMVVVSNARMMLLADYDDVPHDLFQNAIYALTALGHEAVIVFFGDS